MTQRSLSEYKGIILSAAIGFISCIIGNFLPATLNSVIIALLLGIIIGNLFTLSDTISSGVTFTSNRLLELSIIFLAFSIDYGRITALGAWSFAKISVIVFLVILLTFFLARKFRCPGSTGWLIGFGTAICGSSAIAALSSSLPKEKEDIAISMAVVNLYGAIGMLVLPALLLNLDLNVNDAGLLIGGSLHSVGNVAGAGYTISPEIGEASITIKLARVALLTPGLLLFNYLINRDSLSDWKAYFRLPWYLFGFIVITLFISLFSFPPIINDSMEFFGKIALTIAMAAIGLKVDFQKLLQSGRKGLKFGLIIFLIQLVLTGTAIAVS